MPATSGKVSCPEVTLCKKTLKTIVAVNCFYVDAHIAVASFGLPRLFIKAAFEPSQRRNKDFVVQCWLFFAIAQTTVRAIQQISNHYAAR
jgi:hypothetical protein